MITEAILILTTTLVAGELGGGNQVDVKVVHGLTMEECKAAKRSWYLEVADSANPAYPEEKRVLTREAVCLPGKSEPAEEGTVGGLKFEVRR